jgi:suppressor of G2 allele of SKP1
MSAETFRDAGFEAIEQRKWAEAIDCLSKAIDQSKSPAWLLARSQAFMELGQLDVAIADADYAYCTAAERGNDKSRQQMIEAQYRRSVCFFRKKEYANADVCAMWSQRLANGVAVREVKAVQKEGVNEKGYYFATAKAMAEQDKSKDQDPMSKLSALMGGGSSAEKKPYARDWNKAQIWRSQVLRFLEALPEEDTARRITIELTPKKPSKLGPDVQAAKNDVVKSDVAKSDVAKSDVAKSDVAKPTPAPAPAPDYSTFRTQFYQSDTSIAVSVLMKFASKEDMEKVDVRFLKGGKVVSSLDIS